MYFPSFQNRIYIPSPKYSFQLKKNTDIILSVVSVSALTTGFIILQKDILPVSDLVFVSRNDIPQFERYIIDFDSADAAKAGEYSDILELLCGIEAVVSIFSQQNSGKEILTNSTMYVEGLFICAGITEILKRSTDKKRPFVYNTELSDAQRTVSEALQSFPSGHTSFSAFSTFFAASLANNYMLIEENLFLKILIFTNAAVLPAVTGYFRTEAGKHFWTDVAAGYALGAAIGLGIPALHKISSFDVSYTPVFNNEVVGVRMSLKF
jgi:hypothetical protein